MNLFLLIYAAVMTAAFVLALIARSNAVYERELLEAELAGVAGELVDAAGADLRYAKNVRAVEAAAANALRMLGKEVGR